MVAKDNGIVTHVFCHAGIDMRGYGVHIIIVICSIVSLEDVSGIDEDHILLSGCVTDTVDGPFDGIKGLLNVVAHIGRIEEGSMNVIGCEDRKRIVAVFGSRTGDRDYDSCNDGS
jgi:hypothetical protein